QSPVRWLDRGDAGPFADRAVRAHGRRHRERVRDLHPFACRTGPSRTAWMTSRRRPGLDEQGLNDGGPPDEARDAQPQDERHYFAESRQSKTRGRALETDPRRSSVSADEHYHGHRDRLRQRFRDSGDRALADYELLELLLFRLIPRRDTKPLAKALLARFGSLSEVLGAPTHLLTEVKGVGDSVATDLRLVA